MLMALVPSITNANAANRLVYGDDFSVRYIDDEALPVLVSDNITIINSFNELANLQLPSDVANNFTGNFFDLRYLVIVLHGCPGGRSIGFRVDDVKQNGTIVLKEARSGSGGPDVATNRYALIDFCRSFSPTQFNLEIIEIDSGDIIISTFRPHTFPSATIGYGEQEPHSVEIWNVGEHPSSEFTISLSGTGADSFELNRTTIPGLGVGVLYDRETFTIVPRTGLPIGSHMATIVIDGEDLEEPWTFLVRFVVEPEPTAEPPQTEPPPTDPPATEPPTTAPPPAVDPPTNTTPPGRNNPQTSDTSGGYVLLLFGGLALFAAALGLPKLVNKKGK